jgi:RNA polymerase sigma-70 factor (ECF subfamily)
MMTLCLRYTKNTEDAKEVLHNGFLKTFKNIASYNPSLGSLYTWIRAIMVNAAIDFIRRKDKMQPHLELDCMESPVVAVDILDKLDAQELLLLIQQLPPATQMVFNLYVIDGFNHREIASMCGIGEGTSKWHLSEARRLLKQLIRIQQSEV